jgi:hypothetical protein
MKRLMLAMVLAAGCGGIGPEQLCRDAADARCTKLFTCFKGAAERDALMLGASSDECVALLAKECKSDAKPCDAGRLYDVSAATQCISEYKALKCEAVRAGMFPTSCGNTCK